MVEEVKNYSPHTIVVVCSLFLSSVLALGVGQLQAQQAKVIYVYDDLGRLIRVVDQNNECATYEYDAVGNILSITRGTSCLLPPIIDGLSPETAGVGDTACVTITGTNLLGATVTTDNPDVQISRVKVSETTIEVCLNISPFSPAGATRITISTPGGLAQGNFTITPKVAVITQNAVIGRTDRSFEGAALTIEGPVTVTIDGTHRFASLTLRKGALVTHFPATGATSSSLRLTIDGALTIDSSSRIDVTARGYLGGNQPGNTLGRGMTVGFQPGSAGQSGGSYGGLGGGPSPNAVYGDFRDPNELGSGGGRDAGAGGGNGGGLVRIVAGTVQLDGSIVANGGDVSSCCSAAAGSGGGIRIDAGILSGNGQIRANGGLGINSATGGGGGRVAIYYQNLTGFNLANVSAFGGSGNAGTPPNGGAGTVYLQGPGREAGELIIDNNNILTNSLSTPIVPVPSGPMNLTNLTVRRGAKPRLDNQTNLSGTLEVTTSGSELSLRGEKLSASLINVNNGGVITHFFATASAFFKIDLSAGTIVVDKTGRIGAGSRGFLGGNQVGNPYVNAGMTFGFQKGSTGSSGGSYGGLGLASAGGSPNTLYGNPQDPNEPGSGGATDTGGNTGGSGGGLIRIVAQTIKHDGFIGANGGLSDRVGGGSGGGVRIDVGTLSGSGVIVANGGNGGSAGGGGGRIAIYHTDISRFDQSRITASGGTPGGLDGTVVVVNPPLQ